MPSGNDETATMAPASGEKRDRNSANTDQPHYSPNPQDTKLLSGRFLRTDAASKVVIDVESDLADDFGRLGEMSPPDFDGTAKQLFSNLDKATHASDDNGDKQSDKTVNMVDNAKKQASSLTIYPTKLNKEKKNKNKTTQKSKKSIPGKFSDDLDPQEAFDAKAIIIFSSLKSHTQQWKNLDTSLIVGIMPFMENEQTTLQWDLSNIMKHYQLIEPILSHDEWVQIFPHSANLIGQHTKFIKRFGVKLAATNLATLFLPHEFNGVRLLQGRIMNAWWAGAYIFYAPGWKAERNICLDITFGLARPTDWWKQLDPDDTKISPFLSSEIFSDDEGSMHDQERHLQIKFKINKAITEVTPKMWTDGFKQHRHDPATLAIFIKLALTPLTVFDSEWFADLEAQNKLLSSSVTNLWASVYRLGGAPWAYSTTPSPSVKTAESNALPAATTNKPAVIPNVSTLSSVKNPKSVSFEAAIKATGIFLSCIN
jgi:hypothetical protein